MPSPRIEIDLNKIGHNAKKLRELYHSKGIGIIGVTKGVNGNPTIAKALVESGISILADSRISNIKKMRNAGVKAQFLLLRTPFLSQVRDTVQFTDISLNSELTVIKSLSICAIALHTIHKIILMVELGDLREGVLPSEVEEIVEQMLSLKGVELIGIGTNLACFGGIKPDENNMDRLSSIVNDIEEKFGLKMLFISGGNSANYNWFTATNNIGRINQLRIGESIFLGRETLHSEPIPELFLDAFTLVAEVIELKVKPSLPYGSVGQNVLGEIPKFDDEGLITRAILGIGFQDVAIAGLYPILDIQILGASSDHLIVNTKQIDLKVGSEVAFHVNYATLLSAMCSVEVAKIIN